MVWKRKPKGRADVDVPAVASWSAVAQAPDFKDPETQRAEGLADYRKAVAVSDDAPKVSRTPRNRSGRNRNGKRFQ